MCIYSPSGSRIHNSKGPTRVVIDIVEKVVQVDLDKKVLTLRVQHEEKEEGHSGDEKGGAPTWHRSERSRMFVKRSVCLPESADTAASAASYSDGVLAIRFPKKALPSPTTLTIQ